MFEPFIYFNNNKYVQMRDDVYMCANEHKWKLNVADLHCKHEEKYTLNVIIKNIYIRSAQVVVKFCFNANDLKREK